MLKQRILTALIIAPIFAYITIWGSNLTFNIFWVLVIALAAREWSNLIALGSIARSVFIVLTTVLSAIGMYVSLDLITWHWLVPVMIVAVSIAALIWLILVPIWLRGYARSGQIALSSFWLALIGIVILSAFSLAMMVCRINVGGKGLFGLFVLIWCADIGAYFVGRRFGKCPLAPAISPKKTREGFWGGWILAMLVAVAYYFLVTPHLPALIFFTVTAFIIAYATVGDLFESVLKRRCGLKDSGNILPGHGGVLDRIDSWLPTIVLWSSMFFFIGGIN